MKSKRLSFTAVVQPLRTWLHSPANLLLLSIILVGAAARCYTIGAKTIGLDEAFSIWVANHSLWAGWGWLIQIDQHPPFYYSLLHVWQLLFGDLQGTVRALSALCSTLALPFYYGFARRLTSVRVALIATLILALSPFHVRFAQDTRMYGLLTLGVAVTLYLVARVLFDERTAIRRWHWLALAVAQAAVMLTHNTATIFFPLTINLVIGGAMFWPYWQGGVLSPPALHASGFPRQWFRTQALAVLIWLPWAYPFLLQAIKVDKEFWIGSPDAGAIFHVLNNFNFGSPSMGALNVLYWALAFLGLWQLRHKPMHLHAVLLLALFAVPFVGELLVSLRRPIFHERTLIWTTLPYYLLLAMGIEQLSAKVQRRKGAKSGEDPLDLHGPGASVLVERIAAVDKSQIRLCSLVALIVVVALSLISLRNYYVDFQRGDWAKAADVIAHQLKPGDVILFNATWAQLPFDYYFHHYQTQTPLRGLPVDLFDRGILEPKMTEGDLPAMRELLAGHRRIWLVYSHDWYTDPRQLIPAELGRSFQQMDRQELVDVQVMRFERR